MNKPFIRKRCKPFIAILIIIILAVAAFYNGPVYRRYILQSDKIDQEITIALIADLHNQNFGVNQEQLINMISKTEPDIILMSGDMTNSPYHSDAMISFMEQAVKIAPCYYVLGNHEYWSNEEVKICEIVSNTGVTVLRSEMKTIKINNNIIEIHGIDDYDANYYDEDYSQLSWEEHLENLWNESDLNNYSILMSHHPEKIDDYSKYQYDLIVAGHAHGGQGRIPFVLNGLWSPNQGWFPKYAGGEYQLNDFTAMIVSRGLYNYKWMPRIFNPSEVVIITIENNQ